MTASTITLRQGRRPEGRETRSDHNPLHGYSTQDAGCHAAHGLLVLNTKTGQPFKKRWFSERMWGSRRSTAELPIYISTICAVPPSPCFQRQETRHNRSPRSPATRIKTIHQIIEKYLAGTRHLSDAAILNFENSPRTKFANQLQTVAYCSRHKKEKRNAKQ